MKKTVKYRVEVDYINDNEEPFEIAMMTSSPCYTLADAFNLVSKASYEVCVDNKDYLPHISVSEYTDDGLIEIWNNEDVRLEQAVRRGLV